MRSTAGANFARRRRMWRGKQPNTWRAIEQKTAAAQAFYLIVDRPGWAFERIADRIIESYGEKYSMKKSFLKNRERGLKGIAFWWRFLPRLADKRNSAACFYEDISWDDKDITRIARTIGCLCASSKEISTRLRSNRVVRSRNVPVIEVQDGVDTSLFHPADRDVEGREKLRIGWAGNSKLRFRGVDDTKGIKILKEAAMATADIAEWSFLDRYENALDFDKMPDWYRGLDIITCASIKEGTPNPIMEGAASGLLPLSTNVGLLPEIREDGAEVVLVERKVEAFVEAIRELALDRRPLIKAQENNPDIMRAKWDWNNRVQCWREVLGILSRSGSG